MPGSLGKEEGCLSKRRGRAHKGASRDASDVEHTTDNTVRCSISRRGYPGRVWTLGAPGLGRCPVWSAMCLTGRRLASSHSEAAWLAQEVSRSLCRLAFSPKLLLLIPSPGAGSAGVPWAAARRRIRRGGLCDASRSVAWPALLEMPHRWLCVTAPLTPHRHTLKVLR